MNATIGKIWRKTVTATILSTLCALPLAAQDKVKREKVSPVQEQLYVVSAKAGGVNHVSGAVNVTRSATGQTQILATGDELGDRDRVSVGEIGKIEILLNPGSFLRLGENTNLELTDTSLESLKLKLATGSALLEASAVGGNLGADILISTPQTTVKLEKSGIYRINADINATEIYVWKGAARVGDQIIKGGRKTSVGKNGTVAAAAVVKFDKDDARDALDIWSKDRAKEMAKANNRLKNRELARAFQNSSLFGFNSARSFGSGFWVFDRLTRGYCFVPFGFNYWDSPYGYGFNRGIWWGGYQNNPVVVYPTREIRVQTDYPTPVTMSPRVIQPSIAQPTRETASPVQMSPRVLTGREVRDN